MNELLIYAMLQLAIAILIIEAVILGFCVFVIVLSKVIYGLINRWNRFARNRQSLLITEALAEHRTSFFIPHYLRGFKNLFYTITAFNRRIVDEDWVKLKNNLYQKHLEPTAKRWRKSCLMARRLLAARCFLLNSNRAEKEELIALLHDPILLVRIVAAESIINTGHRDLFIELIKKVSTETELAKLSYRDLLINAESEKFEWMIDLLKKNNNLSVSAVCLDVFSTRMTKNLFTLILPFIYGTDRECRVLAVKILKNIPSPEATDVIIHCLKDDEWEVRAEALKSLYPPMIKKAFGTIEKLLLDPVWFVRLQAALVLKKLGNQGLQILSSRNPEREPEAYEISQYVLGLPEV